jgi:hypothetical protein
MSVALIPLNRLVNIHDIWYGGNAIQVNLSAVIFNPISSTILRRLRFRVVSWGHDFQACTAMVWDFLIVGYYYWAYLIVGLFWCTAVGWVCLIVGLFWCTVMGWDCLIVGLLLGLLDCWVILVTSHTIFS